MTGNGMTGNGSVRDGDGGTLGVPKGCCALRWVLGACILFCVSCTSWLPWSSSREIEMAGVVVDSETGRPIDDVRVIFSAEHFRPLELEDFERSETKDTERSVDGSFRFRCLNCTAVDAFFYAEGYHSDSRSIRASGLGGGTSTLDALRLSVKLKPMKDPVHLEKSLGRLEAHTDPGEARVLAWLDTGETFRAMSLREARERAGKAGVEPRYIRLLRRAEGTCSYDPLCAVVDFSTADGGVVVYDSVAGLEETQREMWEAPADGYQPTLELSSSRRSVGSDVYFFVRIGLIYGRGWASVPRKGLSSDPYPRPVHIVLRLNPDGTRNLETSW